MRLSAATLDRLGADVDRPRYDRAALGIGIVHFGVGGFHRAHEAMYVHRLLNAGAAADFAICGVGLRPADERMRDVLREQDGLYTLVERAPDGSSSMQVIGSIVRYLYAPDDPGAVLDVLTAENTRIVSLTVTEGGYCLDPVTGAFNADDAAVQHDLRTREAPRTAFAYLVEALARRRDLGRVPFTVMSCDNVPGNGRVTRNSVAGFAALRDPALAVWIRANVAFPNSMVDRITPASTDLDRADVEARLGVRDEWPVVCEPFAQWVLEDDFPAGRPPWDRVGVQLVEHAEPYEILKIRLLNAGHQALAYLGYLAGHRFVHEAAADPVLAAFYRHYADEVRPTLPPVEGVDVTAYRDELVARFANPAVGDSLDRICAYSSDRVPKFVLPAVQENLAAGRDVALAAAVVAGWARYCEGEDENGEPIELIDPLAASLRERALAERDEPLAFLEDRALFGGLADEPAFTQPYLVTLRALHRAGARSAVATLVEASTP
jgi:mannitol 2-dehydrogenase